MASVRAMSTSRRLRLQEAKNRQTASRPNFCQSRQHIVDSSANSPKHKTAIPRPVAAQKPARITGTSCCRLKAARQSGHSASVVPVVRLPHSAMQSQQKT